MLHIDKWAQGRPRFLAIFAHTFVIIPDEFFEQIESIKNGEIYNGADDDASGISALFAFWSVVG